MYMDIHVSSARTHTICMSHLHAHTLSGSTLMKRRHLKMLGYKLVTIPYYEWNTLQGEQREHYIRDRLLEATVTGG